jgi:hypothetical protein
LHGQDHACLFTRINDVKEERPDGSPSGRLRRSKIGLARHDFECAVMIAMAAVRMVQMTIDKVVDMVAVRHGLVAATRTVLVAPRISTTCSSKWSPCG